MNTGILGGTFDPIHTGHVAIAREALKALSLDRVLLMPSGTPPYKKCRAGRDDRMAMVEIACASQAGLCPCDVEIKRKGKTYTVETLEALRAMYPGDRLTYILGADALDSLGKWRGIDKLAGMAAFAVVGRPGWNRAEAEVEARALREATGLAIVVTELEGEPVSSGQVREHVAEGKPVDGLVPDGVNDYIREHGLYLCDYSEPELLEKLRSSITVHRYHHTLGVADTAERLAPRYGVDPKRARLAGLLHDCAKSLPYGEMRRLVSENVADIDAMELDAEPVLHAPAGMVLARRDYGVRDQSILQAIRRHTIGGEAMTAMDALIYVSDFIEPGRRPFPGLDEVREAAETDIFRAMRMSARLSADYLLSRGQKPHPNSLKVMQQATEARAWPEKSQGGEAK